MAINRQNLLANEWIGLKVTVSESADPGVTGLSGFVRDETRNTFTIQTEARTIRITKLHTTFNTVLPSGEELAVNGSDLRYRPEDRVKKGLNRW
jgi:ribonuclease P protein subunit POP4